MQLNLNPSLLASRYIEETKAQLAAMQGNIHVVGLIASDDKPSIAYARATQQKFDDIGIRYDLRNVRRLELESHILEINEDPNIHGVFIYFPVFNNQQDDYLRNLVDFRKDIEAGSTYWTRKLYKNDRLAILGDQDKKALLPCTPLAIVKMLTEIGVYKIDRPKPLENKTVTIFNRSEVIGRPLAVMMSNDGSRVYSFDVNGPMVFEAAIASETNISRTAALAESDIIITGVPSEHFEKVHAAEIKPGTACVNFSSFQNFAEDINTHTDIYIPRVGPMTVAMCMRNTLRLYENFHQARPQ
ncbi:MAG: 5,10-methylene-tetrahydrofolate dehydrogenase/methenyl tetrahydrofolate cyclohydrolase [Candidatus Azotimanducaceae bacterium]